MIRNLLILICCAGVLLLTACGKKNDVTALSEQEIYFFYQEGCPHCHTAAEYIKENHPNLKIKSLDIAMPGNNRLFQQAARTYKLGINVGTPLICFGEHYVMGWGENSPRLFEMYVKNYE